MISERKEKQFNESQYEILIRCSEKGDMTQWNEWRENNQKVSILLEGANFIGANLEGAELWKAKPETRHLPPSRCLITSIGTCGSGRHSGGLITPNCPRTLAGTAFLIGAKTAVSAAAA